ncbi:N-alpha-acetyltransferase 50-like [Varroa jacobsoni]|uniref:N-terminal methionine N(alpha)-acetyltransferase NatE n=1 Tax=Varroa destructor TaxID=109461 RepID=A0A7M7K4M0_VARDE|nr:N-alpha-acetyltransferase 50-like [Varroa destructor]XP_022687621.1 N-alpha-acetyltransferase 50-like [Varroa jacobsoni]
MPEKTEKLHRIELGAVTPHNYRQLKVLNSVVFPVIYNDKFYQNVLEVGDLARLAYCNDIVVGAVCCRVDKTEMGQRRLYIMTLGCLAPYRRLGIGTKLLKHVLEYAKKDGNFNSIYLHVQVQNDCALKFYDRFDFKVVDTMQNYYKRIKPADAHVLQKSLNPVGSEATNGH